jgi:hypothetical protein
VRRPRLVATPGSIPVKKRTVHADCRHRHRVTCTRSDTAAPTAGRSLSDRT